MGVIIFHGTKKTYTDIFQLMIEKPCRNRTRIYEKRKQTDRERERERERETIKACESPYPFGLKGVNGSQTQQQGSHLHVCGIFK